MGTLQDQLDLLHGIDAAVFAGFAGLAGVAWGTFVPSSGLLCPVIIRGPAAAPHRVALTFDDGPDPAGTPSILDVLREKSARATFFVVGSAVDRHPDLLRRIYAEGHLIANHTYHHRHAAAARWWTTWVHDLNAADDAVERVIGLRPALCRPPMGFKTLHLRRAVHRTGHRVVNWSIAARDGMSTTPDRIVSRVLPGAGPGDIIVMHDGVRSVFPRATDATIAALPRVIDGLRAKGLAFARLDDLLGIPGYAADSPPQHAQVGAPTL